MIKLLKTTAFQSQFKSLLPLLLMVYLSAIAILVLIAIFTQSKGIPVGNLTRDPVSVLCDITNGQYCPPFYTSVLSSLGILLWSTSATIPLFTAAVLLMAPTDSKASSQREAIFFLLATGLLSALLLFDDLFLFHEKVYPKVGLPEKLSFALYGLFLLISVIRFRRFFFKTDFLLLIIAFGFMGLSIIIDTFPEDWSPLHLLFEDGTKFLGIVGWCTYFTTVSAKELWAAFHASKS